MRWRCWPGGGGVPGHVLHCWGDGEECWMRTCLEKYSWDLIYISHIQRQCSLRQVAIHHATQLMRRIKKNVVKNWRK